MGFSFVGRRDKMNETAGKWEGPEWRTPSICEPESGWLRHLPSPGIVARRTGDLARHVAIALLLPALCWATGCGASPDAASSSPPIRVTVSEVTTRKTIDYDVFTGRTEASEIVEVRPRVFGYLKGIEFEDGDHVEEGQKLFLIEPDTYEAIHHQSLARQNLLQARSELAEANLARRQQLYESGAANLEEYQEAQAASAEAKAAMEAAEADSNRTAVDLRYTEIHAPISGRIDRAMVTRGNLVQGGEATGTLLTRIVNEQPMFVYFDVDERSLLRYLRLREKSTREAPGNLRGLGLICEVQLADETDFPHQGVLDFVANQVDPTTGTARIRGRFANEDRALVSGLFVRIRIPTSAPYEALLIPEQALSRDQSSYFVYVVDQQGQVARRVLTLGEQRGNLRIVTSGLEPGEQVIVRGMQRVRDGDQVEVERESMDLASFEPFSEAADGTDLPESELPDMEVPDSESPDSESTDTESLDTEAEEQ